MCNEDEKERAEREIREHREWLKEGDNQKKEDFMNEQLEWMLQKADNDYLVDDIVNKLTPLDDRELMQDEYLEETRRILGEAELSENDKKLIVEMTLFTYRCWGKECGYISELY